jgi:hypothetical protein
MFKEFHMKNRSNFIGVFLALVLVLINSSAVLAGPPVNPNSFYGPVKISGANVPVGTAVTAWCGGVQYALSEYFYDPESGDTVYAFNVPGDISGTVPVEGCTDGQTIIFKVGTYTADQTAVWSSGGQHILLPLTVSNPTVAPVTISGDAGVGGATIAYSGGSTIANSGGIYYFTVDAGWTGAVTPSLPGYTFSPANRTYIHVMDSQPDQNYTATLEVPAPPPLPASFYGTVKSNGDNVPIGTQVSARINGVQYALSPYLGYNGETVYSLNVPGDDPGTPGIIEGGVPGDTIVFFVGGKQAAQTAIWQGGINVNLNLTVSLPDYHFLFLPLAFR